jgi:cytochrome P450
MAFSHSLLPSIDRLPFDRFGLIGRGVNNQNPDDQASSTWVLSNLGEQMIAAFRPLVGKCKSGVPMAQASEQVNVVPEPLTVERLLSDPTSRRDPYALFRELREEAPLYQTTNGVWFVTGYKASRALLSDPRMSRWEAAKSEWLPDPQDDPEIFEIFHRDPELRTAHEAVNTMLINRDDPEHQRLRNLVRQAFLPGAIRMWREKIEVTTDRILDRAVELAEMDFVREVAFPLPEIVICEMSGVPHEDHALWSEWSKAAVGAIRTPKPKGENLRQALESHRHFYHYFKQLIADRRGSMGDDLISILMRAQEEKNKLSEDEIIGTMTLLIQAGHETTANLIGTGMYHLLKRPELYQELRNHPERIPQAVEEFLRFDGPAQFSSPRKALEDVECEGVVIKKGEFVIVSRHAVNRDPDVFPDPDAIDFGRPNLNLHHGFGVGPHSCLGRQLAQLEAQIMFSGIMKRLPDLELIREPEYTPMTTRGFNELWVRRRSLT